MSDLDAALLAIFRHGDWRNATLHMTDEQREAAASAVERAGEMGLLVRWWDHTPERTGLSAVEQFCAAIGKPVPPPMSPEDRAAWEAANVDADRRADAYYGGRV